MVLLEKTCWRFSLVLQPDQSITYLIHRYRELMSSKRSLVSGLQLLFLSIINQSVANSFD